MLHTIVAMGVALTGGAASLSSVGCGGVAAGPLLDDAGDAATDSPGDALTDRSYADIGIAPDGYPIILPVEDAYPHIGSVQDAYAHIGILEDANNEGDAYPHIGIDAGDSDGYPIIH
jgi:hypothetical protein